MHRLEDYFFFFMVGCQENYLSLVLDLAHMLVTILNYSFSDI